MSNQAFLKNVEAGLEDLRERLFESLPLEHEHRDDLAAFGTPTTGVDEEQRAARHLEWFLLERPSESLGAVPLERIFDGLDEAEIAARASAYAALRGSRVGVFLVARVVQADGLLLDDLLGRGQYAVADEALTEAFEPGDLIVGRLFPEDLEHLGEKTLWVLSSAAASFRNPKLRDALVRDLEAMRKRARGPLRMTQSDVEQMFFSEQLRVEVPPDAETSIDLEAKHEAARGLLLASGIEAGKVGELLEVFRVHPLPTDDVALGAEDPLGWVLSELAFDTDLELNQARRVLSGYWHACSQAAETTAEAQPEIIADAAEALARFDKGRAAGHDLDNLFETLEAELGVEAGPGNIAGIPDEALEEGIDGDPAPDFPGVLGALVQEFLWDAARLAETDLDDFAKQHRELELFVQFGAFLGAAEDLASKHIELFLGRWIWEQRRLNRGDYSAEGAVRSLRAFCAWLDENHCSELLVGVGDFFEAVDQDAARLEQLNASKLVTASDVTRTHFFEFVDTDGAMSRWLDKAGGAFEGATPVGAEALLSGDLIAAVRVGDELRIQAVYPALASPYLKATS